MSDGTDVDPPMVPTIGPASDSGNESDRSGSGETGIDIKAFQRGDPRAFAPIMKRFETLVRSIAVGYTVDPHEQEDLYQEILIRVWQKRELYQHRKSMPGWIKAVGRHHAHNWKLRKVAREKALAQHRNQASPREIEDTMLRDPWRLTVYRQFQARLQRALASIPARQAEAFTRVLLQGDSVREIAREMDVSTATVRSHIRHTRKKLRKLLGDSKDELS